MPKIVAALKMDKSQITKRVLKCIQQVKLGGDAASSLVKFAEKYGDDKNLGPTCKELLRLVKA